MSNTKTKLFDNYNELIRLIYKAAIEPTEWEEVYKALTDIYQLSTVSYLEHNLVSRESKVYHYSGLLNDKALQDYQSYYGVITPSIKNVDLYKAGTIFTEQQMPNLLEYLSSETYNDFFKKYQSEHFLCMITDSTSKVSRHLPLRRSSKVGFFTAEEIHFAEMVIPHFVQAHRISKQLNQTTAQNHIFEDIFNHLAHGVLIIKRPNKVIYYNKQAEKVFIRNDGLTLSHNHLKSSFPIENNMVSSILCKIFDLNIEHHKSSNWVETISISRSYGRPPYLLMFVPFIHEENKIHESEELILVTIYDPDSHPIQDEELISKLYGLTISESRIVKALCAGYSPSDIATNMRVSDNAVRFHLKNIFQKLHINRQTELVALILKGPLGKIMSKQD